MIDGRADCRVETILHAEPFVMASRAGQLMFGIGRGSSTSLVIEKYASVVPLVESAVYSIRKTV